MSVLSKETKSTLLLFLAFVFLIAAISVWPFQGKRFASETASIILIILGISSIAMSIKVAGWKAYKDAFKVSFPRISLKIRR